MDLRSLSPELRNKLKEVQTIASRATRQETQGDYEQAFSLYVDSVQKYLYLIRIIQDGPLKEHLKTISSKLLNRAEQIKSSRPQLSLRAPIRDRTSPEEQDIVLQRSQKINGITFPPWSPSTSTPAKGASYEAQTAAIQPALSPVQKETFLEWRSINKTDTIVQLYNHDALDPTDIVQDVVTDCSLIAAFSVLINHAKNFQSKLHVGCVYPKGSDGFPQVPEDGIYRVKLFLNGTEREYMKVMGGYDFVGSNSSVDLHALTGWIPETILLTSQDYRSEQSWNRVHSGFSKGNCLVSVGTNANNLDALESVGLVPCHDYAVINIQEDNKGNRLVTLYNAWNVVEPQPAPQTQWTAQLENALPELVPSRPTERVGTFTISWESLQMYFETVYLNWDPSPFKFQQLVHFFHHPLPAFQLNFDQGSTIEPNPEVWILLTRHLDHQVTDNKRFMSLQVFLDDQERHIWLRKPTIQQTMVFPHWPRLPYRTLHICWLDDPGMTHKPTALTLQILSQVSLSLTDSSPVPLAFSKEIDGQWTAKTSGGNHALATYSNNPMWRITIEEGRPGSTRNESRNFKFKACLTTMDPNGGLDTKKPVNIKLMRSGGDGRVYDVERRELVADSGSYTLGRAQLRVEQILPGKYTIVPSTYQAGVIGSFKLQLECDLPLTKMESIPPEGAGMYKRVGSLSWQEERQGAGFWRLTGGKGLVKTKIKLQASHQPGAYPIKLSLIQHQSSQDEQGKVISQSMFTNALSGAAIGPLQLSFSENFDFTILVEALGNSCVTNGEGYILTIYAEQPLSLDRRIKERK
ncbi:hypothetical protein H4Q26_013994 [Puccinia striiformis f. sp. tritici PST-130]|nr:hypothetical protein H4Q26_013994 [Puccinia striiformis f. sp. tritici PST-130]